MDPDNTLATIRASVADYDDSGDPNAAEEIVQGFKDLDEWLTKGGFLPSTWAQRANHVTLRADQLRDLIGDHCPSHQFPEPGCTLCTTLSLLEGTP